ncbi:MAG TPA: S8 family serine peptidase [Steroidobacteraceae bacterium]|nr:S8 family serine peptidase [Steroidobacteraceae bacterium]
MPHHSKVSRVIAGLIASIAAAGWSGLAASPAADPTAALTPELATRLAHNANRHVLVVMKNMHFKDGDALRDQAPLMAELGQVGAQRVKSFHMVNAFTATVSDGEVQRLKAHPAVAIVAPDVLIRRPVRHALGAAAPTNAVRATASAAANAAVAPHDIPGACAPAGKSWIGEELEVTNTASNGANPHTARALGFTGAGVKVGYIADGVDPNNPNFIRADGSKVFFDYQDFSGDGPGQLTTGGEAFEDSSAIAGQGIIVYDVSHFSAQPLPGPCRIRIEGVAPGASLAGYDVFGSFEYTLQSNFLEAIEYAVTVDQVNVLNESFGSNPFPDVTASDITKLFNDAAVEAGVVVSVSSGDAGATNTQGSPSTDPRVIAAGATTTDRFYAQTDYALARYFATTGWLSDNISSLSSSGFDEAGRTISLVAPGDFSAWASCDPSPLFIDCTNFRGVSSPVESSGGTSLSAPLTSGAAALVIEAYRKGHFGASPTPAQVKHILTSTATDLGMPAQEQGAGLLNTYKAVLLAQSIGNANLLGATNGPRGQTLLLSSNQLNAVGAPGTAEHWPVTVTNTGVARQHVRLQGRAFGRDQNVQSGSVTLTDGVNPTVVNWSGLPSNYSSFKFQVPAGQDRLTAQLAYESPPGASNNARVRLILIDPTGKLAAHSVPQGVGNSGFVDVRQPAAGIWTGVIFSIIAADGGTNSRVPWRVATQQFTSFGEVSPSEFDLDPGQSQKLTVSATTPANPGDASGSIVVSASGDGSDTYVGIERNSIAVTLRSLIQLSHGGTFSGVLTGGNGRPPGEGQENFYQFDVSPNQRSLMVNVMLSNTPTNLIGVYLVNPDGVAVGYGQNTDSATGTPGLAAAAYALNPVPGRWTLILDFPEPITGNEISERFTGNVRLNATWAEAQGLPNNPFIHVPAGQPIVVPVLIRNTGAAPADYFIDARLNTLTNVSLAVLDPPATSAGFSLPLGSDPNNPNFPYYVVPTETSALQAVANATLPIEFDFAAPSGDPDLFGAPVPKGNLVGSYPYFAEGSYAPAGGVVAQGGVWDVAPAEIGPYAGPAPSGYVNTTLTATTKAFDPAVTSTTGDLWLSALDPSYQFGLLPVLPGKDGIIVVTITPQGVSGQVVSGTLYVSHATLGVPPYGAFSADEVYALPYSYTIQ